MSASLNQIYLHIVWSTKYRKPIINSSIELEIYDLIKSELNENECPCLIVNGMPDHVHCLIKMNMQKSVAELMKNVKGSTSHYINQNEITPERFSWQKGYGAFSVSPTKVDQTFAYIMNQKKHHQRQSLTDELNEIEKKLNIDS